MFSIEQKQTIEAALDILKSTFEVSDLALSNPEAVSQFCKLHIASLEHEVFSVLFLNTQNQLIKFETLFRGTIDSASVYPREVAKAALHANAASVILTHNHPGGNANPSKSDEAITERLVTALGLLDIRVLDHVIVTPISSFSFAEAGLL